MNRLAMFFLMCCVSPPGFAWDPFAVLNNAVQGQVNQQIRRGVNEAFKSISTPSTSARPADVEIREARPGEVVIYTAPTCGYCKRALAHMQSRNIPYLEKDVSANAEAQSEWQSLGGRGVPLALFGSQKLNGFAAASYDKAWARFQTEQASAVPVGAVQTSTSAQPTAVPSGPVVNGFTVGDVLVARIARVKFLAEPRPESNTLGQLDKQEEVIYLGEAQGRYLKVRSAAFEGWVDQTLIAKP